MKVSVNGQTIEAKPTFLRLPPDLYRRVKVEGARHGLSASAIVISALEKYLPVLEKKAQ